MRTTLELYIYSILLAVPCTKNDDEKRNDDDIRRHREF